jgi:hypothetical protein
VNPRLEYVNCRLRASEHPGNTLVKGRPSELRLLAAANSGCWRWFLGWALALGVPKGRREAQGQRRDQQADDPNRLRRVRPGSLPRPPRPQRCRSVRETPLCRARVVLAVTAPPVASWLGRSVRRSSRHASNRRRLSQHASEFRRPSRRSVDASRAGDGPLVSSLVALDRGAVHGSRRRSRRNPSFKE